MTKKNAFELVARLNPTISNGTREKEDRFDYNKDAGMYVCPAGAYGDKKKRDRERRERNRTSHLSSTLM